MKAVVWLHEDGLRLDDCPGLPAVFVFDDALMRALGYGLKRIGFIYETLLELEVTIRRGDTVAAVRGFAAEHGAETVGLRPTVCPELRAIIAELGRHLTIEALPEPSFVNAPERLDLGRFSRYWRRVSDQAMLPTVKQDRGRGAWVWPPPHRAARRARWGGSRGARRPARHGPMR